jgi:formate dehydrogenase major subunit
MTNHWCDLQNSDCIMIIGSNAAENHPISFKWITKAIEENGATLISVDPRLTRSASKADIYARLRSGTDIAFVGGMIKWVLDDMEARPERYNMTYVAEYTNAAFLIDPEFQTAAENDGKFSGFQLAEDMPGVGQFGKYDKGTWKWQTDENGVPLKDNTLQDPNCVFQLLKRQFARYDPDMVCSVTGTDKETYTKVCETYARTGGIGKSGTIMYAMGTTQHTHGTQNIRTYAILQLLLGNIGVAGGGINALRGESNVQGSTDHCLLFHILPGYLTPPTADQSALQDHLDTKLAGFATSDPKSASWWLNYPKYFVSLLKSWYGDNAMEANDFGYDWLPKLNPGTNYSHISLFEAMTEGTIKGLLCWGQNPAVGGPNAFAERQALHNLEWLVTVDLWETETCAFWQEPGVDAASIQTEVFALPAAASYEKEGTISNSGRWSQWRWQAVDPPGEAMADLEIVLELMLKVIELYETEGGPNADAITKLRWKGWYDANPPPRGAASLVDLVSREINGWAETQIDNDDGTVQYEEGKLLASFGHLSADGSTSSSNWLYTQSYTETEGQGVNAGEKNRQKWRDNTDYHAAGIGLYSNWSWCWPLNRRIIYNRASVDLAGNPWDPGDFVIKWDSTLNDGKGGWAGDVPDGGWPPMNMEGTRYPFIMKPVGFAHVFGPGLAEGPFPEHYEPLESPIENPLSNTQVNPAVKVWRPNQVAKPGDGYDVVCTTYRVTEHWQAGQMTRNLPWLVELMPQMFVEMSEELAAERDIHTGELVTVESLRGKVQATAIVTKRFKPFNVGGKTVHQIGVPWHWGFTGLCVGDSANNLSPHVGDANTMIPEFKAFLVRVTKGGA